ncbi:hypothetical protein AM501_04975 [Aneurinibacillus migulanus]|uniref:Uncharacterized protein n=1 Tax=Aneurinibacillus migulanus TaxID=47500 RepID=A0A0D1V839_ANEMI|nr:hypothetical protein [Aneurinibacillus migulanus]KIV55304.1 hypothetical protein TS65_16775 [Aneurinibacillus migulanus]KIV55524.1 hypothetical protein TS64_11790 [Aneurinibacillus migulanus]KON96705.1 hypothetical protein AF333_15710 [Aneurinibacillus migulanus]KPD09315.1 hypothetical protein AM501_04975 [Aneurinibacillus migulanus]GED17867.1 hypothetical protein AMI01nite_58580 [Aneurinibacillus migulanus]
MLTILYDELKKQSQADIWSDMHIKFGYEAKMQLQYYPDIWVNKKLIPANILRFFIEMTICSEFVQLVAIK